MLLRPLTAGPCDDAGARIFAVEEEEQMNVPVMTRRLLNGVMCAGLLVATMGPATLAQTPVAGSPVSGEAVTATPGQEAKLMLLPKFLGIVPFEQANRGAEEAAAELQNPVPLDFVGPTADNSVAGQIEFVTNAPAGGYDVVMLSNNSGSQIVPAAQAAQEAGTQIVTWDSEIPSGEGETLFVAQTDSRETGGVLADMALSILGEDGGQFAILSASPDAANQNSWIAAMQTALEDPKYANLELLEIVYGDDQSEKSAEQAQALLSKYPDMDLIVAPTSVGIVAAAKVLQDEGLCEDVKVTGLGVPVEMVEYTLNGCAPEFALWSFVDLGYLTYYVSYLLATGAIEGVEGERFVAGRMGEYEITKDPTRPDVDALRVLMGPFTVYNVDNVEAAAAG
jgi:rhamnose transport system substrate-binding protein